jgi:hypothetical protein
VLKTTQPLELQRRSFPSPLVPPLGPGNCPSEQEAARAFGSRRGAQRSPTSALQRPLPPCSRWRTALPAGEDAGGGRAAAKQPPVPEVPRDADSSHRLRPHRPPSRARRLRTRLVTRQDVPSCSAHEKQPGATDPDYSEAAAPALPAPCPHPV